MTTVKGKTDMIVMVMTAMKEEADYVMITMKKKMIMTTMSTI